MKKTKVRSKSVGIRLGSLRYDMRLLFYLHVFFLFSKSELFPGCINYYFVQNNLIAWGLVKNGAPTRQQQIPENGSNF